MSAVEDLFSAIDNNDVPAVIRLSQQDALVLAVNDKGDTPLHVAAYSGRVEMVKLLLDNKNTKVDAPNQEGLTPLLFAAMCGETAIADVLLGHGAHIQAKSREDGYTALHFASIQGQLETAQLLVRQGAAIDAKANNNGPTPLDMAMAGEHHELVDWLMEAQSKAEQRNRHLEREGASDKVVEGTGISDRTEIASTLPDLGRKRERT